MNWRNWLARSIRGQRVRPRVERLEDHINPTVSLSPIIISGGPAVEGGTIVVSGTYTVLGPIGSANLVIDWGDGSTQSISATEGVDVPFSVSHVVLDDNPTVSPTDTVTVNVRLIDSGPRNLTSKDGGGYRAYDVPGLNINLADALAAVGTTSGVSSAGLDNANEGVVQVPLAGSFRFYGQTYTAVNVSENGVLSFNGQQSSGANSSLSSTSKISLICPFWDDLLSDTSLADRVLYRAVTLDGNGIDYMIFEWSAVPHANNDKTKTATFQALLQLNTGATNGDIIFNYVDTDFGNSAFDFAASATIGIQSGNFVTNGVTNITGFRPDAFKGGQAVRLSVQDFTVNRLAGPEGFGYNSYNIPFESTIDILAGGGGTVRLLGGAGAFDDISTNAAGLLGADTFNFYGKLFDGTTTMNVSDNGLIVFNGLNNSGVNTDLSTVPIPAAIATLWDQWTGVANVSNVFGRIIDFDGDAVGEFLCIEWSQMQNFGSTSDSATWQALLELNTGPDDAGDIYLNYRDTSVGNTSFNAGASATVGIKDTGSQQGTNARRQVIPRGTNGTNFADGKAVVILQTSTPAQSATVVIINTNPVLIVGPDETMFEGDNLSRTITLTDASGFSAGTGDSFTYSIDFGDGSPLGTGTVTQGGRSFPFSHFYADDGKYTVKINLSDDDSGAAAQGTFVVTVENRNPQITFKAGDLPIKPGQVANFDPLVQWQDKGYTYAPANTKETFEVTIDWGDGVVTTVKNVSTGPNVPGIVYTPGGPGVFTKGSLSASHPYLQGGTFTVTITVTDDDGGSDVTTLLVGVGSKSLTVYGADAGGGPLVRGFDNTLTGNPEVFNFYAYDVSFRGGVRVAVADITGDSLADIVTAAGAGGGPHVKVFDGATGDVVRNFFAYTASFLGGVYVATADVDNDNVPDIITAAGAGGGPHVKVFSGATGAEIRSFFAYSAGFLGGVRIAAADVNGDGFADIITGAGAGGGPHVRVFSGMDGKIISEFFAYPASFTGGVNVTAGDINNDKSVDIITGPGLTGGPLVRIFNAQTAEFIGQFNAFPPGVPGSQPPFQGDQLWASGLYVGVTDLDANGVLDLVVGPGAGRKSTVRIFDGPSLTQVREYTVFDPTFLGGVFVAGN